MSMFFANVIFHFDVSRSRVIIVYITTKWISILLLIFFYQISIEAKLEYSDE